jgi:DNA polymerase-3 subunit epsilon
MNLPVLPVYYYHDHFTELVRFVTETYGAVLTEAQHAFFVRFKSLSKDAQCLLIRMINRQGRIFRPSTFRYAEIADIDLALQELAAAGHIRNLLEDDFAAFLSCLAKDALLNTGRDAALLDIRSSWSKAKLADHVFSRLTFDTAYIYGGGREFVALGDIEPIEFLLYLYFGKTQGDLKNFALRDLGILRTNKNANFSARFSDGEEARACFAYSRLLDRLDIVSDDVYRKAAAMLQSGPACPTDYSDELRSQAAHKVGLFFEKKGEAPLAAQLYRLGASSECNERLARLLYATGEREDAEALLRRMIDDPASDDEFVFASDFYARKFYDQRTGRCTELLRTSQVITVDDCWRGNPEAGVAGVMRRQACEVFYVENTLWHCLFGLLFWDELFERGQLHSGFDWVPHCLKDRSFARLFSTEIEAKLAAITSKAALPLILRTVAEKWSKPNGIFAWEHVNMEALRALLLGANPSGIAAILRLMCDDYPPASGTRLPRNAHGCRCDGCRCDVVRAWNRLLAAVCHRGRGDRERLGGHAPRCAHLGRPAVAAREVAIGEADPRDRAAEALLIGLVDLEARLDRQAAQRCAIVLTFDLQRSGRQLDVARRSGAADLNTARDGAVGVDQPRATGAVKAIEGKHLAGDEMASRIGRERISRRRTRRSQTSKHKRNTHTHHDPPVRVIE